MIAYFGDDGHEMLRTLQALRIPNHSSNIGEIVFKIFQEHLEEHLSEE